MSGSKKWGMRIKTELVSLVDSKSTKLLAYCLGVCDGPAQLTLRDAGLGGEPSVQGHARHSEQGCDGLEFCHQEERK